LNGYLKAILDELYKESSNLKSLLIGDATFVGNEIEFVVAYDALGIDELCTKVEKEFEKYGLSVHVKAIRDQEKSIQAQIDALDSELEETLQKQRQEAMQAKKFKIEVQEQKKYRKSLIPDSYTSIKNIPATQSG
jgi:vacuolar-type H+-ATPase subunit I/STV1